MRLVILGGGFTGMAVARRALAAGDEVVATTRSEARAGVLRALGVTPIVGDLADASSASALSAAVGPSTRVLVTFPPDGVTDAWIGRLVSSASRVAYVSSTAVYGSASGRVDEETPLDPGAPRAAARIAAEQVWRGVGGTVVRAPAIYGPGRGLHLRLARGEVRLAPDAGNAISRVHVEDLAAALCAVLASSVRGATYVIGDDAPAPHAEVVRWLCEAMYLPLPPLASASEVDETLRHDRRVSPARIRAELKLTPAYPTYREGFAQCLRADEEAIAAARAARETRD
jgi:nucleoside-diphosphate-sugar epimerase